MHGDEVMFVNGKKTVALKTGNTQTDNKDN